MSIEFACHCGNVFRLNDDEAGGEIQCPNCGRLNDIPLPGDLQSIAADGTFALDEAPILHDPKKAAELIYVYSRGEHDIDGFQKDLRLSDDEAKDIGGGTPVPIANQKQMPHAPRYDPETGELVREIELAPREARVLAPHEHPLATATLSYATVRTPTTMSIGGALLHLLQPGSLAVMGAMFVMHAFTWPLAYVLMNGMIFLGFAIPAFLVGMIAHYGNIVDEIGPCDHDELPRPFRDLHFYEDMWHPFTNACGALMLSYLPMAPIGVLLIGGKLPLNSAIILSALFAGIGSFVFPAVFLTLQTSGTPVNLRPDRVLRVIAVSGPFYFVITAMWIATLALYVMGIVGPFVALAYFSLSRVPETPLLCKWRFTIPFLVGGIFLMHYFCYCLGLLYRAHYADFPWVLQRHHRATSTPVVPAPRAPRRPPFVR